MALELGGHERGVAGGGEQVVEAGEQLVAGGVVEDEAAADARAEGEELGGAEALGEAGVAGEDDAEQLLASRGPCWRGCAARRGRW